MPSSFSVGKPAQTDELLDFVYAVTHDLRSPLVNVRALVAELRLALDELSGALDPKEDRSSSTHKVDANALVSVGIPATLNHIEKSVLKMDGLMSHLAHLSRLSRRKLELSETALDGLIEEILLRKRSEIESRGCCIHVGPLPRLVIDPISMDQVLSELFDNAIKFLDPERVGEIRVYSTSLADGSIQIHVEDNGCGIQEANLERIFAPFRRYGPASLPGEGMGLAIVRALVRRHSGSVSCESVPGQGSRFSITLPAETQL